MSYARAGMRAFDCHVASMYLRTHHLIRQSSYVPIETHNSYSSIRIHLHHSFTSFHIHLDFIPFFFMCLFLHSTSFTYCLILHIPLSTIWLTFSFHFYLHMHTTVVTILVTIPTLCRSTSKLDPVIGLMVRNLGLHGKAETVSVMADKHHQWGFSQSHRDNHQDR